ncbi:junctional cadherin 5-associated protein isoform X1 [Falco cherrug]|uniref:junctional cadherin 5-associated protein isoform X1 n=1 Tax=Falco cherrug TaxID=345164 RepID=UPI00247A3EAD|nr:junctional cadherin 5-associated protein isoform X1 [Falco cherrug]XP_027665599.2 junctional cadherin 5-associated protein isoform X1 [Falco cherrug]XP_027665601.2 junctional cadherin 5-associated protein isoform X1 [Falco cherrug]XP_055564815.1 junctional cadherin 5-associated protein isoform X1 [Falco cherrug]XP_055564816.1 junctional cadherin 5-associated protein isoform X1 [Falco cherrug]
MFSVEDLLISHGYKLSKNPPVSYENRYDGYRHVITGNRSAQRTLNGFEAESRAGAYSKKPLVKTNSSSTESSHGSQGRQAGPGYHHDLQGLSTFHTSEGGVYDRPQLAWSSQPKTDKDLTYWRRRGQDFSVLLGYSQKASVEMKGLAAAPGAPRHPKESQLKVGMGAGYVRRSGLQESCEVPSDCKWQSLGMESWNQPKKVGRQMSEGDREKLLQELYSLTLGGDNVLSAHNKGKSQSLPRVLSPESMRCVEMPSLTNSNNSLSITKTPSYPPNRLSVEPAKHHEPGGHFHPLVKPKYGRPLKPPSYELQRQTRVSVETVGFQDHYQKDEPISYLAKVNEPRQDACIQDSGLEPPVYVPPPSYKSPPHQNTTPHPLNEVPNTDTYASSDQQGPAERVVPCQRPAMNTSETGGDPCKDNHLPHGKQSHARRPADYLRSVQYIPFDDPRIRHIKIAPPEGLQDNAKNTENACSPSSGASQDRDLEIQYNSAFLDASNLSSSAKGERTSNSSTHCNRWLAPSIRDQENCALLDQRDSCSTTNHSPRNKASAEYTKGKLSVRNSHMDSTCETVTKVKKFEPGTGMQSKKSSKKKMNETIFCLVSIPVKSESNLPDTDRNNNITQSPDKNGFDNNGALQEQSLLSMSSTDLELQALTGSMTNKNELQKQELWRPEEFKQMNDLRFIQPTKHRELKYSGSWPGDQYKDQQTQTTFAEEPKSPQFFHGTKPGEPNSNKLLSPKLLGCTASTIGSKQTGLPSDERSCRQSACGIKGQMYFSQSSNSAFSRTATLVFQAPSPKAHQSQAVPAQERETSLLSKGDVVKGEAGTPCNSKELFGQFLLKPVSRRPWDAISELESFNKELQGQEESTSSEEDLESAATSPQADTLMQRRAARNEKSNQEPKHSGKLEMVVPEVPVFKSGRVKSKSESWSVGTEHGGELDCIGSQGSSQPEGSSEGVRPADGSLITEMKMGEAKSRTSKQSVHVGPVERVLSSSPSTSCHSNPFNNPVLQEMSKDQNYLDFVKLSKGATPTNDTVLERGSVVRLSLTKRSQGHSEPDLRSVGLDVAPGSGANNSDHSSNANAVEIPVNESLQARAARILGIDIAVESLLPDDHAGPCTGTSPANGAQDTGSSVGMSTVSDKEGKKESSYEGRRKCGWTESTLFVRAGGQPLYPDECLTTHQEASTKTLVTEQVLEQPASPSQGEDQNLVCKSAVYQHSEKRVRSTSKVIETLQGKLTSPPSRTAMDRLVRMKEVDSVSRMRRLSIKSADSGEEVDEEKLSRAQEERGSKLTSSGAVSKRVISLSENGYLGGMDKKKINKDFSLGKTLLWEIQMGTISLCNGHD